MQTLPAIANLVNSITQTKFELSQIGALARGLKPAGLDLMPVKPDMLASVPEPLRVPCMEACELLFAAILSHEGALIAAARAVDAISVVTARMDAARAEATVAALFRGPTADLLFVVCEAAPIAFYAMTEAAPRLKIIARLKARTASRA
jgi:hypothetical protein